MAASATPKPVKAIAVAFSGGLDSTALLHVTARAAVGMRVVALHVHHGLQVQADHWAAHCAQQAQAYGAGFVCQRLSGQAPRGESVEAWARAGRHAALQNLALEAGADLLLLAHHRRDQAETFLLQALRGAGTAGLSGMPRAQWRQGVCWARPWLELSRDVIQAYAERHSLSWIEDPSNADPRFARNRLRAVLWPAFPQAEAALSQAARWAQEAQALANEVAAEDLAQHAAADRLDMAALAALSPARVSNALRAWLRLRIGQVAPASLIERLLTEWHRGSTATWPAPGGQLHAYRGGLYWAPQAAGGVGLMPLPSPCLLDLSRPGLHPQPAWRGAWAVEPAPFGVAPERLAGLTQRARGGAEQFQHAPASTPRSLKKACQAAGLPAWQRGGPLLFQGEMLIAVAGLGLDARAVVEHGLALRWIEDSAFVQPEGQPHLAA